MKISIVTPSFNQGGFLEETIRSVIEQPDVEVEYVVMDGGSSDDSADIIQKHASRLAHWESVKDAGQYDAVTRGFLKTSGEIMGWINSDDKYAPNTFSMVAEIFRAHPQIEWLTTTQQVRWDAKGRGVRIIHVPGFTREGFQAGEYLPVRNQFSLGWIQQESTFWRRSLWNKAGGQVGDGYPLAGDFELWARFYKHADLVAVDTPLGGFRFHGDQKTGGDRQDYLEEAEKALRAHGGVRHGVWSQKMRKLGLIKYPAPLVRHHRQTCEWNICEKRI